MIRQGKRVLVVDALTQKGGIQRRCKFEAFFSYIKISSQSFIIIDRSNNIEYELEV